MMRKSLGLCVMAETVELDETIDCFDFDFVLCLSFPSFKVTDSPSFHRAVILKHFINMGTEASKVRIISCLCTAGPKLNFMSLLAFHSYVA
jgi:hypothetical protein